MHHPHHEELINHDVFTRLLTMRDPFQNPAAWAMVELWGDDELDDLEDELEGELEEEEDLEEEEELEEEDHGLHARFAELERRSREVVQRIEALAAELERQARLGQQD